MAHFEEELFAVCLPGLEQVLLTECRPLDPSARAVPGGVELRGARGLHRRANLWLRTASRVLMRVGEVRLNQGSKDLERAFSAIPSRGLLIPGQELSVSVTAPLGRSLPELLARAWGVKLGKVKDEGGALVRLRLSHGLCLVSVDTSGELLHLRGYRQEVALAPLRETLAAGLLALAGYDGKGPVYDPMCGSGTLLIEAVRFAKGLPPGSQRRFRFESWPSFDKEAWEAERAAAGDGARSPPEVGPFRGSDLNAGALGTARRNARRAGVLEHIALERLDARKLAPWSGVTPGLVICNLPYGQRVAERSALKQLYSDFARSLSEAFPGWRVGLLAREPALLAAAFQREPVSQTALKNGGIPCTFSVFKTDA
jgi:putative N6-adenine-specific DNA methylase